MKNYTKTNVGCAARTELHDSLALTGAEVSVNRLPAGASVPFVHAHKQNEEIYGILSGKGKAVIDGEEVALTAGDWLKIAPAAKRRTMRAWITSAFRSKRIRWVALPPTTPWWNDPRQTHAKTSAARVMRACGGFVMLANRCDFSKRAAFLPSRAAHASRSARYTLATVMVAGSPLISHSLV